MMLLLFQVVMGECRLIPPLPPPPMDRELELEFEDMKEGLWLPEEKDEEATPPEGPPPPPLPVTGLA